MSFVEQTDPLWELLVGVAEDEGVQLYDLERQGAQGVRVTIAAGRSAAPDVASPDKISPDNVSPDNGDTSAVREVGIAEGAGLPGSTEAGSGLRGGVTSGHCSRLCRRLMMIFQAEGTKFGLIMEPEIDVSSPGINRTLRLPDHFRGAVGERVQLICEEYGSGSDHVPGRTLVGTLVAFEQGTGAPGDGAVSIEDETAGSIIRVPLRCVRRARVEFKF